MTPRNPSAISVLVRDARRAPRLVWSSADDTSRLDASGSESTRRARAKANFGCSARVGARSGSARAVPAEEQRRLAADVTPPGVRLAVRRERDHDLEERAAVVDARQDLTGRQRDVL